MSRASGGNVVRTFGAAFVIRHQPIASASGPHGRRAFGKQAAFAAGRSADAQHASCLRKLRQDFWPVGLPAASSPLACLGFACAEDACFLVARHVSDRHFNLQLGRHLSELLLGLCNHHVRCAAFLAVVAFR